MFVRKSEADNKRDDLSTLCVDSRECHRYCSDISLEEAFIPIETSYDMAAK